METSSGIPSSNTASPKALLLLPDSSLSSCVFGALVRDTRGCELGFDDRYNHFAASPLCAISWTFDGDVRVIDIDGDISRPEEAPLPPSLSFAGPQLVPRSSWNTGDIYALTLCFYPDAFARLTGLSVEPYFNRIVPLEEVLEGELLELFLRVGEIGDAEEGFEFLMERLTRLWGEVRPARNPLALRVSDWTRSLATQAYFSGFGRSARQIERRIRSWTGQSMRSLNIYARNDQAFEMAIHAKREGRLHLAELSAELGFADQAHMSRDVRKQTGFSPAELMRRMETEESLWSFRLLGERY